LVAGTAKRKREIKKFAETGGRGVGFGRL